MELTAERLAGSEDGRRVMRGLVELIEAGRRLDPGEQAAVYTLLDAAWGGGAVELPDVVERMRSELLRHVRLPG